MADIELVIKIPEEIYIHSLSRYKYQGINDVGLSESEKVGVAIKNGTLLPKGHGRLKDTDKLDVGETFDEDGNRLGYRYVTKDELDDLPTIIDADKESE